MKTQILLLLLIVFSKCTLSQVPSYIPSNGLLCWYPFNGNANDESGNSHHGISNGATLTMDRFGNANEAYSFNGMNTEIRVPNSSALNLTGDFSISIWFKSINPPTNNNSHTLIAKRDDNLSCCSSNVPWNFSINYQQNGIDYKKPICAFASNSYTFNQSDSLITLNTWQQLIFIYKSDTLIMYLDGDQIYSSYSSSAQRATNTNDMLIGSINRATGDEYMNGDLDDIGIWNRALTPAEIQQIYINTTAINELNASNNLIVYPNPVSEELFIVKNSELSKNIFLFDALGQKIKTWKTTSSTFSVSVKELSSGVYYITDDKSDLMNRIIKE